MTNEEYDKLELAIDRYVDALDLSDLIQIVTDDLWSYYRKSANDEERQIFIKEVQDIFGDVAQ